MKIRDDVASLVNDHASTLSIELVATKLATNWPSDADDTRLNAFGHELRGKLQVIESRLHMPQRIGRNVVTRFKLSVFCLIHESSDKKWPQQQHQKEHQQ